MPSDAFQHVSLEFAALNPHTAAQSDEHAFHLVSRTIRLNVLFLSMSVHRSHASAAPVVSRVAQPFMVVQIFERKLCRAE